MKSRMAGGIVLGLQRRIMLYVTLGLLALLGLFGYIALQAINQGTQNVFRERRTLAQALAGHIDGIVRHFRIEFDRSAAPIGIALARKDQQALEISLRDLATHLTEYHGAQLASSIFLLGAEGRLDAAYPRPPDTGVANPVRRGLADTLGTLQATVTAAEPSSAGRAPAALFAAPVLGTDGRVLGLLAAEVHVTWQSLQMSSLFPEPEGHYSLELIAADGQVVASSDPLRTGAPTRHLSLLLPEPEQARATVAEHTEPASSPGSGKHVVAVAGLESLPWLVTLEQPRDEALVIPETMERQFLTLGAVAVGVGLLLAWVTTAQVVRPIRRLTEASQRIAAGGLDAPVPLGGEDEVGILGRSMESMRRQLQASLERIENWNRELEQHVHERTAELEGLYQELRQKEAERTLLLEKIMGAQEEERRRVARDLHDEVAQALAGLAMGLSRSEELVPQDPASAREHLASLNAMVRRMIEEVRRIMVELRPSLLDDLGLEAAVAWYAETRLGPEGVRVACRVQGMNDRLPAQIETAVFRVVQEAVSNVAKHAQAREVRIRLERTDGRIVGTVEDDGVGFDASQVRSPTGKGAALGLQGMEERVSLLGGNMRVVSQPRAGTRVEFAIPLSREQGR